MFIPFLIPYGFSESVVNLVYPITYGIPSGDLRMPDFTDEIRDQFRKYLWDRLFHSTLGMPYVIG